MVAWLKNEFDPHTLLPSLIAGLIAATIGVTVEISFAALIFSGPLTPYLANGIGLALFGAVVFGAITAVFSAFRGAVSLPQDSPVAILAVIASGVVAKVAVSTSGDAAFATVVAIISLSSLLTGVLFILLSVFKLGDLIRYIPYPVIGGFLAGTGWLLVRGGFSISAPVPQNWADVTVLFGPTLLIQWLPAVIYGIIFIVVTRKFSHFLLMPSLVIGATILFYVFLFVTNTSFDSATRMGLMLGPFPGGVSWKPLTLDLLRQVDWGLVGSQILPIGSIMIVSTISMLLNYSGLEVIAGQDLNLNRELRTSGIANIAAGLVGATPGYTALSLSALGRRLGSDKRLTAITFTVLCLLALLLGASLLAVLPKFVLSGLLVFIGMSFVIEWLYDGWSRFSRADYVIMVLIVITMASAGVLEGIGVGLVCAIFSFAAQMSRVDVIKSVRTGKEVRSNVERRQTYQTLLNIQGDEIYIVELKGFVFFGSANHLLNQIQQRITDDKLTRPDYIILDFRQVTGIDVSAEMSFVKLLQLAQMYKLKLAFSNMAPDIEKRLGKAVFTPKTADIWHKSPDIDRAAEWAEDQVIQRYEHGEFPETGEMPIPNPADTLSENLGGNMVTSMAGRSSSRRISLRGTSAGLAMMRDRFNKYLERREVPEQTTLIKQDEVSKGMYFLESGQVTVYLEAEGEHPVRLRVSGGGSVLGEIGMYGAAPATASVITSKPSVVHYMSKENLLQMERDDPVLAAAFHRSVAEIMSERLQQSTDALEIALR